MYVPKKEKEKGQPWYYQEISPKKDFLKKNFLTQNSLQKIIKYLKKLKKPVKKNTNQHQKIFQI